MQPNMTEHLRGKPILPSTRADGTCPTRTWTESARFLASQTYDEFRLQYERNIQVMREVNPGLASQISDLTYWVFDCDPRRCLVKRPIYVLGFNPAAHEKTYSTEHVDWDSLGTCDQPPANPPRGLETLRRRIEAVVIAVLNGLPLQERCCFDDVPRSTLYFYRTPKATDIGGYIRAAAGGQADFDCWKYHEKLLALIRPSVILCYGNGKGDSTFNIVRGKLCGTESPVHDGQHWYNHGCTRFAEVPDRFGGRQNILLIGVPHLSRYAPEAKCCANRVLSELTAIVQARSGMR